MGESSSALMAGTTAPTASKSGVRPRERVSSRSMTARIGSSGSRRRERYIASRRGFARRHPPGAQFEAEYWTGCFRAHGVPRRSAQVEDGDCRCRRWRDPPWTCRGWCSGSARESLHGCDFACRRKRLGAWPNESRGESSRDVVQDGRSMGEQRADGGYDGDLCLEGRGTATGRVSSRSMTATIGSSGPGDGNGSFTAWVSSASSDGKASIRCGNIWRCFRAPRGLLSSRSAPRGRW